MKNVEIKVDLNKLTITKVINKLEFQLIEKKIYCTPDTNNS